MSNCTCTPNAGCPIHGRVRDMDDPDNPASPFVDLEAITVKALEASFRSNEREEELRLLCQAMMGRMRKVYDEIQKAIRDPTYADTIAQISHAASELDTFLKQPPASVEIVGGSGS